MSYEFKPLEEEDVIQIDNVVAGNDLNLSFNNLSSMSLLANHLRELFTRMINISSRTKAPLLQDGLDCKVIKLNSKGWKKGKIRIRLVLEFRPDEPEISEPESPLDEMRKALGKDS